MRIAMTIHALSGGGAERVFCRLAARWVEAGHEVHVVTWSASDADTCDLPDNSKRYGLDLMKSSRGCLHALWANCNRIRQLRKTLVRIQPDLILSFCDQMNICTLQAARGMSVPVWIAERSDPAQQVLSPLWERWRRRVYPTCAGCVTQTDQIAEYLSKQIPRERIKVIPNAVVPPAAVPQHTPSKKVLFAIGRLSGEKGFDILLEAWKQARQRLADSNWQLHLAGEGPSRDELQRMAADIPGVHFLGWLPEPQAAFAQATMFVLPSRYEGFPNVLLEAMSHGLPSIATRCSQAVAELSRDGNAVMVVTTESPRELAEAIVQLANSDEMRTRLGAAAQQVSQGYSWQRIGKLWDQILPTQNRQ